MKKIYLSLATVAFFQVSNASADFRNSGEQMDQRGGEREDTSTSRFGGGGRGGQESRPSLEDLQKLKPLLNLVEIMAKSGVKFKEIMTDLQSSGLSPETIKRALQRAVPEIRALAQAIQQYGPAIQNLASR
jgi:hypothetical protein